MKNCGKWDAKFLKTALTNTADRTPDKIYTTSVTIELSAKFLHIRNPAISV